jgi:hypothetical protein
MAKISADFIGTCQICGRPQKLPSDKLAKHGYKVAGYGFFVGTCPGSDHLPYERSCDLLPPMITTQKTIVTCLKARLETEFPVITDLTTMVQADLPFVNLVNPRYKGQTTSLRVLAKVEVAYTNAEGTYKTYRLVPVESVDATRYVFKTYDTYESKPLELLNRAQDILRDEVQNEMENRQHWIDWATDRVAKWVPDAPLTPLTKTPETVDGKVVRDLNKFETSIMKDDKASNDSIAVYNDRSSYFHTNTVTYNRVKKLVDDGFLKLLGRGTNKDGNYLQVTLN